MQNKIVGFVRDMAFSLIMIAFSFGWLYTTSSLHVICELQSNETYSCVAQHEIFGWGPIKTKANNVTDIEWDLKCSGTASNRGCAYVSHFQTTTGEEVKLSNNFTSDKDKVDELVQTIKSLMQEKSPLIDYTGKGSMLLSGSLFFCLAPILLFVPFLKLLPSKQGEGPRTLISWGKKEK